MHHITESLAVGNLEEAKNPPAHFGGLLFLAEEYDLAPPERLAYARIPLKEFSEVDALTLKRAVDWLERSVAGSRVLVCCRAGMGRSVSVVIAYLCCVLDMPYAEAVSLVRARRPGATLVPRLEETIREVRGLRGATTPPRR